MDQVSAERRKLYFGGSALYAAVYLHYGVTTPFLPVWLGKKGFSPEEISILLSIPLFLKLGVLGPMMTFADRLRRVRDLTWVVTATASVILFTLHYISGFALMAAMTALFAVFWDPIPVLTDAYAVGAARDHHLDFGRMRIWASVIFVIANLGSGLILRRIGVEWTVWVGAAMLAVPLIVLPFLPSDRSFQGARRAKRGEWTVLLKDRSLLLMILSVSILQASHALMQNFASIQWMRQGMSESLVGALWATAVASEGLVLWFGRRWLGQRSPALLVMLGVVAATTRWTLMSFGLTGPFLFMTQMLNGFSIMAPILAMMLFIERRVPPHLTASAQGMYAPVWSALMAVTTVAAGPLWRMFDTRAYLFMAGLALLGGVVSLFALSAMRAQPVPPEALTVL